VDVRRLTGRNQAAIPYRSAERWSARSAIEDVRVRIQLTDGVLTFDTDEVVAVWHHTHSLADAGLEG
jgi:hypothetical protein